MTLPVGTYLEKSSRKKEIFYIADDYDRLTPPNSGNYELQNGRIIFVPTPFVLQQRLSGKLHYWLMDYLMKTKLGTALAAPMDVYFDEYNVVQPDLLYISKERLRKIEDNGKIKGAPDLVAEILSEGHKPKEVSYKKHLFEYFGVREYWLINLDKQTLIQYENTENGLIPLSILGIEDTLHALVLPKFSLALKNIF
jgi:Uma2 family endonuclease